MKEAKYTIYGLSVNGSDRFFYIGVTSFGIEHRLYMHLSSVRTGHDRNKSKSGVFKDNGYDISCKEIDVMFGTRRDATKLEKEYIIKFEKEGHPLTNLTAGRRLTVGGEKIKNPFNLRTTKFILSSFMEEAISKNTSVNLLFNQTLLPKARKLKEKNNSKK